MPMTLYCTRAKSFVVQENNGGTKKHLLQPGPSPQSVPFWVAETDTFKYGIKDGSIVNLTPPHLMPGYKAPTPEEVVAEQQEAANEEEGPEQPQQEIPGAPFGGQPMTPVAPAPKVGGVRAGAGRGGK